MKETDLPFWTQRHVIEGDDEGRRDPLRAQVVMDTMADDLFRSGEAKTPGLTSLTDHLGYLVFHAWAQRFSREMSSRASTSAYNRLVWQHAFQNQPLRDGGRYVVYGINRLKRLPLARSGIVSVPAWGASPTKVVVLDPQARYGVFCQAIGDAVDKAAERYLHGCGGLYGTLIRIARGDTSGILSDQRLSRVFALGGSRLRTFGVLAKHLAGLGLAGQQGLGSGLGAARLGDTLVELARPKKAPDTDLWTYDFVFKRAAPEDKIRRRLYRAALGRTLVFAANRAFYEWAFKKIGESIPRSRSPLQSVSSFELVAKVQKLLADNSDDREALYGIDSRCEPAGTSFRLGQLINGIRNQGDLERYVVECALNSGKGFVNEKAEVEREDLVREFSGSYAGSLRLAQAWRFGNDLKDALVANGKN